MKAAVCIVLTLVLISLPSRQVLAQTLPEGPGEDDLTFVLEDASQPEPGVGALTPPAVLLWQPIGGKNAALSDESPVDPTPAPAWSDWSTEKKWLVVGGGVLALVILGIVSIG